MIGGSEGSEGGAVMGSLALGSEFDSGILVGKEGPNMVSLE